MKRMFIVCAAAMALIGCKKEETPSVAEPPMPGARPTTQEILSSKRTPTQLGSTPLRMDLPELWKFQRGTPTLTVVQGPTPGGNASMFIMKRMAPRTTADGPEPTEPYRFNAEDVTRIGDDAKAQADAGKIRSAAQRTIGLPPAVATVVEVISADPATSPATTVAGRPPVPVAKWDVHVFTPEGGKFIGYRINLYLPLSQYEQDRAFLESILGTLAYDPLLARDAKEPGGPK